MCLTITGHTHTLSPNFYAPFLTSEHEEFPKWCCRTVDMTIFGILRFLSEEVALSVRGRLGHPRFACARGMYFRRFARRSSVGESASLENVSTAWGARSRISEGRTGRHPSQIVLRVDLTTQRLPRETQSRARSWQRFGCLSETHNTPP